MLESRIDNHEVKQAIEFLKTKKASGFDGLPAEFIKYSVCINENIIELFTKLFNRILETQQIPDAWKIGIICNVYKNKGEKSNPDNYRGITLLPVISKIFLKILANRLQQWVEMNNILNEC